MSATLVPPLRVDSGRRGGHRGGTYEARRVEGPASRLFLVAEPRGAYRAVGPVATGHGATEGDAGSGTDDPSAASGTGGHAAGSGTDDPAAVSGTGAHAAGSGTDDPAAVSDTGAHAAGSDTDDPAAAQPADGSGEILDQLDTSVDAVGAVDLAAMSDDHLDVHLQRLRRPIAALEAARARALAEVERRVSAAAGPHRRNAEVQETRRRAAKRQRMTPSEAKRTAEAGRHADRHQATGRAFDGGDIGPTHVRLIGEALEQLPEEQRADTELELLELARVKDAVVFGRQVRELLARRAPEAAHLQERRRDRDRRFRMTDTADGGVAFSGLAFGAAAELARTALGAFRRPDTPDEHRTPEQRGADAFEQLCEAALRLGEAPTIHGERPQVIVVVEEDQLGEQVGVAHFAGSGQPVTLAEARSLLADCTVSRLVRRADGTPIEVSRNVRTVPAGLWRALVVRDGGCRWEGCDAPASWCDVAHGRHPYREEGRLSPDNAVLLCRRHHRRFDAGPWRLEIDGDAVTFHREVVPFLHPADRAESDYPAARARAGPEPPVDPGEPEAIAFEDDVGALDEVRMLGPPAQLPFDEY